MPSSKAAFALPGVLGGYELVMWGVAPEHYSTHHGEKLRSRVFNAAVHSLPHLCFAAAAYGRADVPAVADVLYAPYLFTVTTLQGLHTLLPWLGVHTAFAPQHRHELREAHALPGVPALPKSVLRPSLEDTILFPLSVAATAVLMATPASPLPASEAGPVRILAALSTVAHLGFAGYVVAQSVRPVEAEKLADEDRDAVGAPWERLVPALVFFGLHAAFAVRTYHRYLH
jgi:hypothetical protein